MEIGSLVVWRFYLSWNHQAPLEAQTLNLLSGNRRALSAKLCKYYDFVCTSAALYYY